MRWLELLKGERLKAVKNRPAEGEPVVLVHGIWNSSRSLAKLSRRLEQAGFEPFAWDLKPNDGTASLMHLGAQLAERIESNLGPERVFSLIGFSMGGIVSRCYLQRLGGVRRVRKLVTLGSPHNGTVWGHLGYKPGMREMRPGSELLAELNRELEPLKQLDILSLYTPFDLLIVPAKSSHLTLGRTERLWVPTHQRLLADRYTSERVIRFLKG